VLERQANVYRGVFDVLMANPALVDRITFCAITDRYSWLNYWPWKRVHHGLLFNRESKPKQAFHAVTKVLMKG
jgi:endo-1,4-beta-xylanase